MEVRKSSCIKVFLEDFSFNKNLLQPVQKSSGRICFFSLNSWSLQNTHVTQVPFIAPSCFSSNPKLSHHLRYIVSQTVPTRRTHGEPPPACCLCSVQSLLFHRLASDWCVWLGPVALVTGRVQIRESWQARPLRNELPVSSPSFTFVLVEQVPWSGCTVWINIFCLCFSRPDTSALNETILCVKSQHSRPQAVGVVQMK